MIDKKQRRGELRERTKAYRNKLKEIGEALGLKVRFERGVPGVRTDVLWYYSFPKGASQFEQEIPIVAFEIEGAWRTEKTIKGDFVNLLLMRPLYGIVLFLERGFRIDYGKGFQIEDNLRVARVMAENFSRFGRFLVWTQKEVDDLYMSLVNEGLISKTDIPQLG